MLTVEENDILSEDNGVRAHRVFHSASHIIYQYYFLSVFMFFHHQLADSEICSLQEDGGRKRRWRDCGEETGQQWRRWKSSKAGGGDKGGQ